MVSDCGVLRKQARLTTSHAGSAAFTTIAGAFTIDRFMQKAAEVPNLEPLGENVVFISDDAAIGDLSAWAEGNGVPQDSIFCSSAPDVASALAEAINAMPGLSSSNLIVANMDAAFGNNFSLRSLVQHASIRGGDVISVMKPVAGMPSYEQSKVSVEKSQVVRVESHAADAMVLAPLIFLTQSSLSILGTAPGGVGFRSIVRNLLLAGRKVYASHVDFFFDISTSSGLSLADSFLSQPIVPVLVSPAFEGPAARALREVTQTAKRMGLATNDVAEELVDQSGAVSVERKALVGFLAKVASGARSPTSKLTKTTLPAKFDATLIKHKPRQQHPCYQTTNNIYGSKKANEMHMPELYAPSSQAFSNGFPDPGGSNAASMVTGMRKSKVHTALDEF
jgi:hypothetical protein